MILYDPAQPFDLRAFGIEIPLRDSRTARTFDHLCHHPVLGPRIGHWHRIPSNEAVTRQDLLRVHTADYIEKLFSPALEDEIIQTFELLDAQGRYNRYDPARAALPLTGLFHRLLEMAAGSVQCCRMALKCGFVFYFGGGAHHAHAAYGNGFCLLNDVVIAARAVQAARSADTIWIIDVDAHKGDGTAALTRGDDSVVTLSIHMGRGWPLDGENFDAEGRWNDSFIPSDIDIPVYRGEEDRYLEKLGAGLERLGGYRTPDLAIVVSGADPYEHDELPSTSEIKLTLEQMMQRDLLVYRFLKERNIPKAYLMAGGYGERVWEVYAQFLEFALSDTISS